MRFPSPLIEGRLQRRYKRFLADVVMLGGQQVTVHCANPGSMKTCIVEGGRVWLSDSHSSTRKLRYTWEVAEVGRTRVFVNPVRANDVVAEALERNQIAPLVGYRQVRREVSFGLRSRVDFLLEGKKPCFVEVKNVTLDLGAGRSAFPDSVTERGTRHLEELARERNAGARAVLLFCAARSDAKSVEPASEIDPTYARALGQAVAQGVEVLAYKVSTTKHSVNLGRAVPVRLNA